MYTNNQLFQRIQSPVSLFQYRIAVNNFIAALKAEYKLWDLNPSKSSATDSVHTTLRVQVQMLPFFSGT